MYTPIFILFFIFISSSVADTLSKDASNCPSFYSKKHNMMVDQESVVVERIGPAPEMEGLDLENIPDSGIITVPIGVPTKTNECRVVVKGQTCTACGKKTSSFNNQCCDKTVKPNAHGLCDCVDSGCKQKSERFNPTYFDHFRISNLRCLPSSSLSLSSWYGLTQVSSSQNLVKSCDAKEIWLNQWTFDELAYQSNYDECIQGKGIEQDCGKCNEKAINGRCCGRGNLHDDGLCWCNCKSGCPSGAQCIGGWCRHVAAGESCGACGDPPIKDQCCETSAIITSVRGNKDLCHCNSGKECTRGNDCKSGDICCTTKYKCIPKNNCPKGYGLV